MITVVVLVTRALLSEARGQFGARPPIDASDRARVDHLDAELAQRLHS